MNPNPFKISYKTKLAPLPKYTCQQDIDFLLENNEIHFEMNSAVIDASSNTLLNELINAINQCPETKIEIGGHTDSHGDEEYNLQLSQERAIAVKNFLIKNGVSEERLSAVGYGETTPIADNKSEEEMAKNRRIEFKVEGF